jgi:hypothetical protein
VLEPDEGKPSSPVLRGLGASDGARLLDNYPETGFEEIDVRTAIRIARISSKRTSVSFHWIRTYE